jgi:NADPH-dependent 7-cyano-7-deazaguanine reductase QueF
LSPLERRRLLTTAPNPDAKIDYLIVLEGHLEGARSEQPVTVAVRYVPDRHILDAAAFGRYLAAVAEVPWSSLEEIGVAVLADVSDQLVPRWIQVWVATPVSNVPGVTRHDAILEDRQPTWNNAALLARLKGN